MPGKPPNQWPHLPHKPSTSSAVSNLLGSILLVKTSPLWVSVGWCLISLPGVSTNISWATDNEIRSVRGSERRAAEYVLYPDLTAPKHRVLSSRHTRSTGRPSAFSRKIYIGIASALADVDMAIYSASHVDVAVDPCRLDRQDNGHERAPSLDRSSKNMPVVDFAVSKSPARSASGDITSCASAKSSVESVLWRRRSGFVATYCMSRLRARSCEMFHDDTFDASRVIATVVSCRLRRAAKSSFIKCEEHVADCSPACSPPFGAKSQKFSGKYVGRADLGKLRGSNLCGVDRRCVLHEILHLDGEGQ